MKVPQAHAHNQMKQFTYAHCILYTQAHMHNEAVHLCTLYSVYLPPLPHPMCEIRIPTPVSPRLMVHRMVLFFSVVQHLYG